MITLQVPPTFSQGIHFDKEHHALSSAPLIGKTTTSKTDIARANSLMLAVYHELSGIPREYITYEILAKVLCLSQA